MKEILNYIDTEMSVLDRSLVITPKNKEQLERFARAGGNESLILMQMAVQYGYKIALENLLENINAKK